MLDLASLLIARGVLLRSIRNAETMLELGDDLGEDERIQLADYIDRDRLDDIRRDTLGIRAAMDLVDLELLGYGWTP